MTIKVNKFNDRNKRQERNLMITNLFLYNCDGKNIKRKIDLNKIDGITISELGSEFSIHVPDEYDYRFSQYPNRDEIIAKILCECEKIKGKGL